jgi:hypothetical protein
MVNRFFVYISKTGRMKNPDSGEAFLHEPGFFQVFRKVYSSKYDFLADAFLSGLQGAVTRNYTSRFLSLCCGQRSPTWSM